MPRRECRCRSTPVNRAGGTTMLQAANAAARLRSGHQEANSASVCTFRSRTSTRAGQRVTIGLKILQHLRALARSTACPTLLQALRLLYDGTIYMVLISSARRRLCRKRVKPQGYVGHAFRFSQSRFRPGYSESGYVLYQRPETSTGDQQGKQFFFEKKNRKTFSLRALQKPPRQQNQKFFAAFFQKSRPCLSCWTSNDQELGPLVLLAQVTFRTTSARTRTFLWAATTRRDG